MSEAMAPAGWYPDAQSPDTLRWWDGREWTAHTHPAQSAATPAAPVVEAATPAQTMPGQPISAIRHPAPEPRHRGGLFGGKRELEEEVARLQQTLADLGVTERDQLRTELVDLRSEIPALKHERDELNGVVGPLRVEVADLRAKQQELHLHEISD